MEMVEIRKDCWLSARAKPRRKRSRFSWLTLSSASVRFADGRPSVCVSAWFVSRQTDCSGVTLLCITRVRPCRLAKAVSQRLAARREIF